MTDISKYKSVALSHDDCNKLDKIRAVIVPGVSVSRAKDYRCTNCGHDTKQHINGRIRYLQLDESDKKWIKDNIKNG
jgi:uncharacterized ferredoxin-like protein